MSPRMIRDDTTLVIQTTASNQGHEFFRVGFSQPNGSIFQAPQTHAGSQHFLKTTWNEADR